MSAHPPLCIITGANSGIGKAAAIQIAQPGATVILACRNALRGQQALSEIVHTTGNSNIHLMSLDTSSIASIQRFVADFETRFDRLDVLINNAGNFDLTQKNPNITSEGFETIFATNYLGPWHLTHLLLPHLRSSASARIINIGSKGLLAYPFLHIEFDNLDGSRKFSPQRAYYHSKLASLIHTLELARQLKGSGVVANIVRVPAVQVDLDRLPVIPAWQLAIYKMKRRYALTTNQMAKTYTALALDNVWGTRTGQYVDERQRAVTVPRKAQDKQTSAELWRVSEAMLSSLG